MDWQDEGLILGVRKHGETSAIIEAMTAKHGRHLGLVRGGRSSKMRPILQPGNFVSLQWRARLEEQLGTYTVEAGDLMAASLMRSQLGIYGIQTLASHLRLLPERDPNVGLYLALPAFLNKHEEGWGVVPPTEQINQGFKLSSFFLDRHIYNPRGMKHPDERHGFIKAINKLTKGDAA